MESPETDFEKCFLLLNQTFALADFLALNLVLVIETPSSQRCWSSNRENVQIDHLSKELSIRDTDFWLKSGKVIDQQVLEADKLFDVKVDCVTTDGSENDADAVADIHTHIGSQRANGDDMLEKKSLKPEILKSLSEDEDDVLGNYYNIDDVDYGAPEKGSNFAQSYVDESLKAAEGKENNRENPLDDVLGRCDISDVFLGDQCQECAATLASDEERRTHYNKAHLICVECGKKFTLMPSLKRHVANIHQKLKLHPCELCDKRFGHTAEKFRHLQNCHSQDSITIESQTAPIEPDIGWEDASVASRSSIQIGCMNKDCQQSFSGEFEAMEHYKNIHCKCEECGGIFKTEKNLREHVDCVHKRLLLYDCKICGAKFRHTSFLTRHIRKEHQDTIYGKPRRMGRPKKAPKPVSPIFCRMEDCKENFVSKAEEVEHFRQTHRKCVQCDMIFKNGKRLENHINRVHKGAPMYTCKTCGTKCRHPGLLWIHMKKEHPDTIQFALTNAPVLPCSECEMTFGARHELNEHIKAIHFQCNTCGLGFTSREKMENHAIVKHETEKKVKCQKCNFACKLPSTLRIHDMRKHQNMSNCICSVCGTTFSTIGALKMHSKYRHQAERTVTCKACPKKFVTMNEMRAHFREIHKVQVLGCETCGKRYNDKRAFRKHKRRHLEQETGIGNHETKFSPVLPKVEIDSMFKDGNLS